MVLETLYTRYIASPKSQELIIRLGLLALIWLYAFSVRLVRHQNQLVAFIILLYAQADRLYSCQADATAYSCTLALQQLQVACRQPQRLHGHPSTGLYQFLGLIHLRS